MDNLIFYENWINEDLNWSHDGWVFIKRITLPSGKSHVFLSRIKTLKNLKRMKMDGESAAPVNMALLRPEIYRIEKNQEGKLVTKRLTPTETFLKKFIGLDNFSVGLNNSKTPKWRDTISQTSLRNVLDDAENWIPFEDWVELNVE